MQLKFYAKPGHLVHRPGPKMTGQVAQYVGRKFVRLNDEEGKKLGTAGRHSALKAPAAFALDSDEAPQLIRYAQKGGLWPADATTAHAIGVPFTRLHFDEAQAEWVPETETHDAKPAESSEKPPAAAELPKPKSKE